VLEHCRAKYLTMPGWTEDITKATRPEDLPREVHNLIEYVERSAMVKVDAVSVGPNREQVVVMR